MAAGQTAQLSLDYVPSLSDPDAVSLHVEIEYDDDELPDDDASERFSINVVKPEIPAVADLSGATASGALQLSWSQPLGLQGTEAQQVTEDVERYTDFIISNIGEWTTYDVDQSYNYYYGGNGIPTYPNMAGPAAFYVFNPYALGIGEGYLEPHSGQKFFMAFAPQPNASGATPAADDWLVSPLLSGDAQTITFWVKNGNPDLAEDFSVYYSTTDNMLTTWTSSAVKLGDRKGTAQWTEVQFELPAGAQYFAIHYHTANGNGLLIDDITYRAAARASELTFVGYHVYRDGQRITTTPLTTTAYTVSPLADGIYTVTVQYQEVESAASNEVVVNNGVVTAIRPVIPSSRPESAAPLYSLEGRRLSKAPRRQIVVTRGRKYVNQ